METMNKFNNVLFFFAFLNTLTNKFIWKVQKNAAKTQTSAHNVTQEDGNGTCGGIFGSQGEGSIVVVVEF